MTGAEAPLSYDRVQGELFQVLPELEIFVREEFQDDLVFEAPGNYFLFEDVVFPMIKKIAWDADANQSMKELFVFFERMAGSSDEDVLDLLGIAITENLAIDTELLSQIERFIGPKTSQMVDRDVKLLKSSVTEGM